MLANTSNYNDRIQAGKKVELNILNALRQKGIKIDPPTSHEDMVDKIDGWWIGKSDSRHPVQVKFRQSGDDILFELVKDLDRKIKGRDIISKSTLYLISNRSGTTRLFHAKPIKNKSEELVKMIDSDLIKNPNKTEWSGNGWQVKIQYDRADGHRKLVAYYSPNMFDVVATWNLNLNECLLKIILKSVILEIINNK